MRGAGVVDQVRGLGPHDHVCWRYEGRAEFRGRSAEFLAEGLKLGQRVCYTAVGGVDALAEELSDVDGMAEALEHGAAQVRPINPARSAAFEPGSLVEACVADTEEALAEGFTGMRVAADVTPLVHGHHDPCAFARYEHTLDRYMVTSPFSMMCAFDGAQLGEPVIELLACMHPMASPEITRFRLYAGERPDCAAALGGELDLATVDLFERALRSADLRPSGTDLAFDASDLDFIDHRHLMLLATYAGERGARAVLRTRREGLTRVIEILKLRNVHVEPLA